MLFDDTDIDLYASLIKDSTHKSVSISDIVVAQTHLLSEEYHSLSTILNTHTTLFDSILKVYLHYLLNLDVIPNAIPWHLQVYPVAHTVEGFKNRINMSL